MIEEIDIFQSNLVPKHEILDDDEKNKLLEKLGITSKQLPKIKSSDPAVKAIEAKKGDVIKIIRNSPTASNYLYYRVVVN
ncbi:MAG: DNA-directed RNA polymerase subunit H [Candidatus Aenigmatarchaeota archaeon]